MNFKRFFPFLGLLFSVIVLVMVFLPTLNASGYDSYSGFQIIMGYTISDIPIIGVTKLPFSVLGLLAFLFPIAAGIISVVMPKGYLISVILFAVGAVLLFILPQYINIVHIIGNSVTTIDVEWTLLSAPIIAGIVSALGMVVGLLEFLNIK